MAREVGFFPEYPKGTDTNGINVSENEIKSLKGYIIFLFIKIIYAHRRNLLHYATHKWWVLIFLQINLSHFSLFSSFF